MPIGFIVRNQDQRSRDYEALKEVYRPSHADYTVEAKYGIRDYRGGGRSSAREHVARVVAGAIAKQVLRTCGISIDESVVRCPDERIAREMETLIREVKADGDSVGGVVSCVIRGLPAGVGEPVFDRFQARLGYYLLGINAAKRDD